MIAIASYNPGSRGAKALRDALRQKGYRCNILASPERSRYRQKASHFVINWGVSDQRYNVEPSLNYFSNVNDASDKSRAFNVLGASGVNIPQCTTDVQVAREWGRVMARTLLRSHSGNGLYYCDLRDGGELLTSYDGSPVRLYVQYIPKTAEYRVHVCGEEVADVQRKARQREVPDDQVNWQIRNHHNGFIFARNEDMGEVPQCVKDEAIKAVRALGLHYGAVDIGYHDRHGAVVYEVNTAPGLEGTTVDNLSDIIINRYI
ncbi:MAG TPA: hypothetical protein V6D20_04960 [Candidatus Obscuribacterales bacterium]